MRVLRNQHLTAIQVIDDRTLLVLFERPAADALIGFDGPHERLAPGVVVANGGLARRASRATRCSLNRF